MPLPAMTVDQINEKLKIGADDLRQVLEDNTVSPHAQAVVINGGLDTLRRFGRFATSEAAFRQALKDLLNIDETEDLAMRVCVADLASAWVDSQKQLAREAEIRADAGWMVRNTSLSLATSSR